MKRGISWWAMHWVHNTIAHGLLPYAEFCDQFPRLHKIADALFNFHDVTCPPDDQFNQKVFSEEPAPTPIKKYNVN